MSRFRALATIPALWLMVACTAAAPLPPAAPDSVPAEHPETVLRLNAGSPAPINDSGDGVFDLLVTEAARRCGYETDWVHVPAQRSLSLVAARVDDGDGPRIREMDEIIPGLVRVDEPILRYEFVAVASDPTLVIEGWEDLLPYSIGFVRGWKIAERELAQARSLTGVRDFELAFQLLREGRVDVVLAERLIALHGVGRDTDLHVLAPFVSRDMYLFVSEERSELAAPLAAALREMKSDGAFERVVNEALGELAAEFPYVQSP